MVLKALGTAYTESNKDSSRIVSQEMLNFESLNDVKQWSHLQGRLVDIQYSGLQIVKVKINCFFLDQVSCIRVELCVVIV